MQVTYRGSIDPRFEAHYGHDFFSKWLRGDFKIENCQICPLRDLITRCLFYENGDVSDSDPSLLVKASLKGAIVIKLGTV